MGGVETIGLRELNQNPSRAVARVRAGETLLVTDRGRPILRMVPEVPASDVMRRLLTEGTVAAPAEPGMPELQPDLLPDGPSPSEVLLTERQRDRGR